MILPAPRLSFLTVLIEISTHGLCLPRNLNASYIFDCFSFGPVAFSRAYINFRSTGDIIKFRDQYDGFTFKDSRGAWV